MKAVHSCYRFIQASPLFERLNQHTQEKMWDILRHCFLVSWKINKVQTPFFATLQKMNLQSEKDFTLKLFYLRVNLAKAEKPLWGEHVRLGPSWPSCSYSAFQVTSLTCSVHLNSGASGQRHFQATQTIQAKQLFNWLWKWRLKAFGNRCWLDSLI